MKMTTVTTEWREMVVGIPLRNKKMGEIKARVYGCFALHRVKELSKVMWSLTHIPTGRRLAVYADTPTIEAIAPVAVKVHEAHGDAWNTDSVYKAQKLANECRALWDAEAVTA